MNDVNRTFDAKLAPSTDAKHPKMLASLVANTVNYALARGLTMDAITASTANLDASTNGLTSKDLIDPEGRLPQEFVPTIWNLLSKLYPGQALSLHMAKATPFSFFGPLVYGVQYAENLCSVLHTLVRYRFVWSDQLHMAVKASETETVFQIRHPMDALDRGYGAEVGLALGTRFIREVLGIEDFLRRVEFHHAPLSPIATYEEFFGVEVRFEQEHNAFVIDPDAIARPIQTCDPDLFAFIQAHLDLTHQRLTRSDEPEEMVTLRQAIAHNAEQSDYSAEALAQRMNMSLRTLQRLTQKYGVSVRDLLEQAREANARELLQDRRLSVEAIAFLLGYSEDRSFRRAFKRWTGQTPAQFRRQGC